MTPTKASSNGAPRPAALDSTSSGPKASSSSKPSNTTISIPVTTTVARLAVVGEDPADGRPTDHRLRHAVVRA